MNICGLLVHSAPNHVDRLVDDMGHLDGVEVHMKTADDRIIVTVEDTDTTFAGDQILAIHRLDGVIAAALTFHHFEDDAPASAAA